MPGFHRSIKGLIDHQAFAPVTLVLLTLAFFLEFVWRDQALVLADSSTEVLTQWRPYLAYWASALAAGEFPLWSHNLGAGFPLGAFPHAGMFYPPYLVFLLTDFDSGFTILIGIQQIIRALLTYYLLRQWPCSRFVSWLGAAIFVSCGLSLPVTGFLPMYNTMTWTTGIFLFALRFARSGRLADLLMLVPFCALAFLGGAVEIFLFSLIFLFAFLSFAERTSFGRLLALALIVGVSLLVCSGPLLFSWTFIHHSYRASASFNDAGANWPGLIFFAQAFVPAAVGFSHLKWNYLGFLVALGISALIGDRRHRRLFHLTLAIIIVTSLYIANPWPLNALFNLVPVINFGSVDMRYKTVYAFVPIILLAAGVGLERLRGGTDRLLLKYVLGFTIICVAYQSIWLALDYGYAKTLTVFSASRLVFIMALVAGSFLVGMSGKKTGRTVVAPSLLLMIFTLDLVVANLVGAYRAEPAPVENPRYLTELARTDPTARVHFVSYKSQNRELWTMVNLDQGPGYLFAFIRHSLFRHQRALRGLCDDPFNTFTYQSVSPRSKPLFDFLSVSMILSANVPVPLAQLLPLDSPLLKSRHMEQGRYHNERPETNNDAYLMLPGSRWEVEVELTPGDVLRMRVEPRDPGPWVVLTGEALEATQWKGSWAKARRESDGHRWIPLPIETTGAYLLAIEVPMEAKETQFIMDPAIVNPKRPFKTIVESPWQIYRNPDSLDRYGLYSAVTRADDEQTFKLLFEPESFDPVRTLILPIEASDHGVASGPGRARKNGDVRVLEYHHNRVVLETANPATAFLSIAEQYFPGWRAWVDGRETMMVRANYAYQALPLKTTGHHLITLKFAPIAFGLGLWAGMASVVALMAFTLGYKAGVFQRSEGH